MVSVTRALAAVVVGVVTSVLISKYYNWMNERDEHRLNDMRKRTDDSIAAAFTTIREVDSRTF